MFPGNSNLFVVYLTTLFRQLWLYGVEWKRGKWRINWKGSWRMRSWPDCKVLSRCSAGETERNHENVRVDSRSQGRDLNPWPPEYEAWVLTTRTRSSLGTVRILLLSSVYEVLRVGVPQSVLCQTTDWTSGVRSPAEAKNFSSNLYVQTSSGVHTASWPVGTGGSFRG
jgi:hypothetical protein